jgi:hypothetical protein
MRQQDLQSAEEFKRWCRTAAQWLRRRLAEEPGLASYRMDKRCYYLCRRLGQIAPQWLSADDLLSIPCLAPITGDVDNLALVAGLARFSNAALSLPVSPPAGAEVRPGTAAATAADEKAARERGWSPVTPHRLPEIIDVVMAWRAALVRHDPTEAFIARERFRTLTCCLQVGRFGDDGKPGPGDHRRDNLPLGNPELEEGLLHLRQVASKCDGATDREQREALDGVLQASELAPATVLPTVGQSGTDPEPALSDLQYDILAGLLRLKATSPDQRQSSEALAPELPNKTSATALREAAKPMVGRYLGSKSGPGGGYWLTDSGRQLIEQVQNR